MQSRDQQTFTGVVGLVVAHVDNCSFLFHVIMQLWHDFWHDREVVMRVGDFILDRTNHIFIIYKIETDYVYAKCVHGDEIKFKRGEHRIFREIFGDDE